LTGIAEFHEFFRQCATLSGLCTFEIICTAKHGGAGMSGVVLRSRLRRCRSRACEETRHPDTMPPSDRDTTTRLSNNCRHVGGESYAARCALGEYLGLLVLGERFGSVSTNAASASICAPQNASAAAARIPFRVRMLAFVNVASLTLIRGSAHNHAGAVASLSP